jgi:glycosyltransferase involved in cell wall biosynthesis
MNIIVLEKYPSSQRGGQERSLLDVTRQLAKRGHQITLIHQNDGDFLEQYRSFCDQVIQVKGFAISLRNWRSSLWFLQDLLRLLRQVRTDNRDTVIYANQFYDLPLAALLRRLKHVPLVCHLRLPSPQNLDIQRSWSLRQVQQFISVSHANRQGWLESKLVRSPINVVHNGVLPEQFAPMSSFETLREAWKLPLTSRVVTYVGRLDRRKGLETLISAFAKVLPKHPNSQLLIAGKPLLDGASYSDELQAFSNNLGVADHVRFLGHISNAKEAFHVSDLTVVPSQWPEPCARVIIESMTAGTPVVASRSGGNVELLGDTYAANLFDARNVDALAAVLEANLNWRSDSPELSHELCQHATKCFHLDDKITAIEQLLVATLNRGTS